MMTCRIQPLFTINKHLTDKYCSAAPSHSAQVTVSYFIYIDTLLQEESRTGQLPIWNKKVQSREATLRRGNKVRP